ncbi:MAG TPA: glycosyltransferase family 39 protein [Bryobacteraceae bacterium]|nr:glycosyltransferase family 39 protein [Bryobacteraceae bacterium]
MRLLATLAASATCLYFFLAGLAFLAKTGVENDETIFAMAFLKPFGGTAIRIGHSRIPLMIMSYIGTLKAWIYRPIFRIFGTGILVIRLPMLLAGVASVWLFFLFLRRIAGQRAAVIGCALLAVDSSYLLTICYDWGPVALQHLLLVAGLYLLVRFYQQRTHGALFWGCFVLGLGLWDKALAVWMLSGIGVAAIAVFSRRILALLTKGRFAIAVLGFLLGALPLEVYNVENDWITFGGNFKKDTSDIPGKARMLMNTARGGGLFGWMFDEGWQTPAPHAPQGLVQKASAEISSLAGHPRQHLLFHAFLLALVLAPLARGDALRTVVFALLAMAVAWVQMAITASAGGSVHHTILLWPFPQLVVAVSLAAASRRLGRAGIPALAVAGAALTMSGVLVTNEYHYVSFRYGGAPVWSEAVFTLADYMKGVHAGNIYCVDWGIFDSLRLLDRGKLPLADGSDPIAKPELSPEDRQQVERMVAEPGAVFIAHTKDFENFAGVNEKLVRFAAQAGRQREMIAVIPDTYGRKAYEVYRLSGTQPDLAR